MAGDRCATRRISSDRCGTRRFLVGKAGNVTRGLVVVSGAAGFVGRALCAHFVSTGVPCRGIVRAEPPGSSARDTPVVLGDLATTPDERLAAAVEGAFAVVHLAGRAHVLRETAPAAAAACHAANVIATQRLALAAAGAGVQRFVLAGTLKVHGEASAPGRAFRADDPYAPQDAYAQSKVDAERALVAACSGTPMVPILLRLPLVYGPGVRANFLALLDAIARRAPLPLRSIDNRRDLLYVGNLVSAIAALLDRPEPPRGAWLIADGEPVSTPDLVRRIAAALGVAPRLWPVPLPLLEAAARLAGRRAEFLRIASSLAVDASPLARLIGPPPFTLDQGLAATAKWWRARHAI
jgi:nucleoside-diphosphate-sugar epimerase